MKLKEVTIKNFRCLVDATVPIDDTTVLVGENNSGKTSFLEALRVALPRVFSERSEPFDQYDFYTCKSEGTTKTCNDIMIELWFREDNPDEWPVALTQALNEIVQTNPIADLDSIGLRVTTNCDDVSKEIDSKWEFLNLKGQPLTGKGADPRNISKFLSYIKLLYLSAIRDPSDEFSSRSQFWGRILRSLKISEAQQKTLEAELIRLNHCCPN